MPYLDAHPVPLPFTGRTSQSRQASLRGARVATVKAGSQASRMLACYAHYGPMSDGDMARLLALPDARISARRAGLMIKGWVRYSGEEMGEHGTKVCQWRITQAGQRVAAGL